MALLGQESRLACGPVIPRQSRRRSPIHGSRVAGISTFRRLGTGQAALSCEQRLSLSLGVGFSCAHARNARPSTAPPAISSNAPTTSRPDVNVLCGSCSCGSTNTASVMNKSPMISALTARAPAPAVLLLVLGCSFDFLHLHSLVEFVKF